jgi:hypothetical protein
MSSAARAHRARLLREPPMAAGTIDIRIVCDIFVT